MPGQRLAREAAISALGVAPVWAVLLLIHFGEPRLEKKFPALEPLQEHLWVTPTTALLLTCGGLAWLLVVYRRAVRASEATAEPATPD